MHLSRCRLTEKQQDRLAEFFGGGVTARTAADLADVNHKTAAFFYHRLREMIAEHLAQSAPFSGEVELDESYFGGHRKGKRGRGAAGKVAVFGILKRGGRVYTLVAPDLRRETLMPIIREKVVPDSFVYTDSYNVYDILDVSEFHHHRIDHSAAFARDKHNHINGIENFWNHAKRTLSRYNGIPRGNFALFLKEAEFRFNYGTPRDQLRQLRRWARQAANA
jgi:transposase